MRAFTDQPQRARKPSPRPSKQASVGVARCLHARGSESPRGNHVRRIRDRFLLMIAHTAALLACAACDGNWERSVVRPGLRNSSDVTEVVAIRRYHDALSCDALRAGSGAISLMGLDEAEVVTLSSGAFADLSASHQVDASAIRASPGCGAAVAASARLASPILITWDLRTADPSQGDGVPPGTVYLEQFGAELRPSAGAGMFVAAWRPESAQP